LTDQRREEIRHAAVTVFARHGYRDASIAQIAAELGVGHGTIYRYFENKRAIVGFVMSHSLAQLAEVVIQERADETQDIGQYRAQVERICKKLFALLCDDPDIGRIIFVVAGEVDTEIRLEIESGFALMAASTEQYLINGIAKGFLDPGLDTAATSFLLNGVILEGGRQLLRSANPAAESARWIDAGCKLMFDGITAA